MVNDVTTAAGTVANTLLNVFPQFGRRMSIVDAITCKPFPTPVGKWYHTLGAAPEATQFMNGVELFTSSRYYKPLGQQNLDPNKDVFEGVDGCGGTFEPQNYMQYKFTQGLLDISIDELINRLQHPAPPPPVPPPRRARRRRARRRRRRRRRRRAVPARRAARTRVQGGGGILYAGLLAHGRRTLRRAGDRADRALPRQRAAAVAATPVARGAAAACRRRWRAADGSGDARLAGATLSTLRRPDPHPTRPLAEVYDGMSYASGESYDAAATRDFRQRPDALRRRHHHRRRRCGHCRTCGDRRHDGATIASAVEPDMLPCVSAVRADGAWTASGRATAASARATTRRRNSVDPLEVQQAPPRFRRAFLHSVKLYLPQTREFASLSSSPPSPPAGPGAGSRRCAATVPWPRRQRPGRERARQPRAGGAVSPSTTTRKSTGRSPTCSTCG